MNRRFSRALFVAGFIPVLAGLPRAYGAEENFYEGKTIKIIVSSSPGGGTDTSARLVSRFISRYIPGNPKTVVENRPGGGGTIANNYFAGEVKADGLTILQDSSSGIENFVRGGPTVKYDPRKNAYIGGIARGGSLLVVRKDARARVTNRAAPPVVIGDTDGIRSWVAMTVWLAEYLGWNLRWIYGYPGSNELALAIRQGEIEMWATQNAKLIKDLQREGVVDVLCTEESERRKDFPEAPTFVEVLGAKRPSGLAWQSYRGWAGSPDLDKFLVAPPGTPERSVKILREAFVKMAGDPDVDKEGDKFFGEGWRILSGDKMEQAVREHIDIPQEAKDFIAKLRQKYGLPVGEKKT